MFIYVFTALVWVSSTAKHRSFTINSSTRDKMSVLKSSEMLSFRIFYEKNGIEAFVVSVGLEPHKLFKIVISNGHILINAKHVFYNKTLWINKLSHHGRAYTTLQIKQAKGDWRVN